MTTSTFPGQGRYSVYTGRSTNWPMVIFSIALALPLLAMSNADGSSRLDWAFPVVLGAVVLLNVLTGSSVRTTAGPNGVSIRFGLLGWPRCAYRIEQISHAEVVDLSLWSVSYGFWWTPRRTCCTVRSGPTLRLTLRSGRRVTVTVPDPYAAVEAINQSRQASA
jgi:hypothetical protein